MNQMPRDNRIAKNSMAGQAPEAPPMMNTIFWLLMGAAVAQIIAAIFGVLHASSDAYRQDAIKTLAAQNVKDVTTDMLDMMSVATVGTITVMAVAAVILYVLIGLFLKKGMGWARLAGTGLALISFSRYMGVNTPGGMATILQIVLGLAAIVLCFMGPAAVFFKDKRIHKLARRKNARLAR